MEKIERFLEDHREQMVQSICELVRIPSVDAPPEGEYPFGRNMQRALDYVFDLGRSMGFTAKDVDHYSGHLEWGNSGKLFGVLGHLDVVPAGTGWSVEPFAGIVKDGMIWGRGVSDDKGPMVAAMYALWAVKQSGLEPKNRVRLIFGTNEENEWKGIKHYFSKEQAPVFAVTPDAGYPGTFAEKGILTFDVRGDMDFSEPAAVQVREMEGGEAHNMVPPQAHLSLRCDNVQGVLEQAREFSRTSGVSLQAQALEETGAVDVRFQGKAAHGAVPEMGKNAIFGLLDFLSILDTGPSVARAVKKLRALFSGDISGKALGIAGMDDVSGSLTLNLGVLRVVQGRVVATLDIRYPVFFDFDRIWQQITLCCAPFSATLTSHNPPLFVSPEHPRLRQLMEVFASVTGEKGTMSTMGGGTYARAVPTGVAFGANWPGEQTYAHQPDERKTIDSFMLHARIYAHLLARWLGATDC